MQFKTISTLVARHKVDTHFFLTKKLNKSRAKIAIFYKEAMFLKLYRKAWAPNNTPTGVVP